MSPIGTPEPGSYPLESATNLANVTIAFPGEKWSDRRASGAIRPGDAVVPTGSAGKLYMRKVTASAGSIQQMAIAMRPVDVPDQNPGSQYAEALGPNDIRNLTIANGDYVLAGYSGAFHLTLIEAAAYAPGDLIGWKPAGTPQTGKGDASSGCWAKAGAGTTDPLFEVSLFRATNTAGTEGVLTVRSLRGQF